MKNIYSVVGLMSGTSLDGLDIAHCIFTYDENNWTFKLENSKTVDYPDELSHQLKNAINVPAVDLLLLDKEYGSWLGLQVKRFIDEYKVSVDFISSHGHTIFHQPDKKLTYQIGDGQELANTSQHQTVCNFRVLDVSLGGQGAPLVPIGDQLLFGQYEFCLNLGGIANCSFEKNGDRIAFDICPANMLLNYLGNKVGKAFDQDGQMAKSGEVDNQLLGQLNSLSYYHQTYPKSLGYEWFEEQVIPLFEMSDLSIDDQLCTAVHHMAKQICDNLREETTNPPQRVLVTGGGTRNMFLIDCLKAYSEDVFTVIVPDDNIIDFKEAVIFAFMGLRKVRGEINCLKSVTGAQVDSSGGVIYQPN